MVKGSLTNENVLYSSTDVRSCRPCQLLTKSPRAAFTRRCCLRIDRPLKRGEAMSMEYMLPQPPETSWTRMDVGESFSWRRAVISRSAWVPSAATLEKSGRVVERGRSCVGRGVRCRRGDGGTEAIRGARRMRGRTARQDRQIIVAVASVVEVVMRRDRGVGEKMVMVMVVVDAEGRVVWVPL